MINTGGKLLAIKTGIIEMKKIGSGRNLAKNGDKKAKKGKQAGNNDNDDGQKKIIFGFHAA